MGSKHYILLYDGVCGFCNSTVHLIIAQDVVKTMQFAAIQSSYGKEILRRHPWLREIDSLILIELGDHPGEMIYIRSTGALVVAGYLGGLWNIFRIGWIVPRAVRDWLYDTFARYRYTLFGKYDACLLPPPEVRSRFID